MISWMYEDIRNLQNEQDKLRFRTVLADVFLEIIWDESIKPSEQIDIVFNPANTSDELNRVTLEQLIQAEGSVVYRYINIITGKIDYMCGKEPCKQSVVDYFERNTSDPINVLEANKETTGRIYGFILPKVKEGKLVLKTSDVVVNKGNIPHKGKECENVSTIDGHKEQLRLIREMIEALGYPPLLLRDTILNEKQTRVKDSVKLPKKKEDDNLSPMEREQKQMREKLFKDTRKFQNAIKACALKNIILRMVDKMERQNKRLRYFYRPIATIKAKHKLK